MGFIIDRSKRVLLKHLYCEAVWWSGGTIGKLSKRLCRSYTTADGQGDHCSPTCLLQLSAGQLGFPRDAKVLVHGSYTFAQAFQTAVPHAFSVYIPVTNDREMQAKNASDENESLSDPLIELPSSAATDEKVMLSYLRKGFFDEIVMLSSSKDALTLRSNVERCTYWARHWSSVLAAGGRLRIIGRFQPEDFGQALVSTDLFLLKSKITDDAAGCDVSNVQVPTPVPLKALGFKVIEFVSLPSVTPLSAVIFVRLHAAECMQLKKERSTSARHNAFASIARLAQRGAAKVDARERHHQQLLTQRTRFAEQQQLGYVERKVLNSVMARQDPQINNQRSQSVQSSSPFRSFPDDAVFSRTSR